MNEGHEQPLQPVLHFDLEDRPPAEYWTRRNNQSSQQPPLLPPPPESDVVPQSVVRARLEAALARQQATSQQENNLQQQQQPIHFAPPALAAFPAPFSVLPTHPQLNSHIVPASSPPPPPAAAPLSIAQPHPLLPLLPTPPHPPQPPLIPRGYSANFTTINPGFGPPIPAIVLKKRRRRRMRNGTTTATATTTPLASSSSGVPSTADVPQDSVAASSTSPSQDDALEERDDVEEEEEGDEDEEDGQPHMGGSCPDLTDQQLNLWDDVLFDRLVIRPDGLIRTDNPDDPMQSSIYEIVPHIDVNDSEVETSTRIQILPDDGAAADNDDGGGNVPPFPNWATTSTIPRVENVMPMQRTQITFDRKTGSVHTNVLIPNKYTSLRAPHPLNAHKGAAVAARQKAVIRTRSELDLDEALSINVLQRAMPSLQDVMLSESELPAPTRWQQLQWALKRRQQAIEAQYSRVDNGQQQQQQQQQQPERACCNIS